ncbi:triphosphoribosyl-dephospho-CoA synthase [Methyloparacoccus murrellii]
MSGAAVRPGRQAAAEAAYRWACELELRAFKPGNVSLHSEGHDMTVEDFRRSARVSAPWLCELELGLGERICRATEVTRAEVGCNTNLGILLLAAPLLAAFLSPVRRSSLHEALRQTLATTSVDDATWVYRAIRCANPAGLGDAAEQDVHDKPTVSLFDAMRLAADRDRVARQYSDSFADIFRIAVPLYDARLSLGDDEEWATVAVFVSFLSRHPDSHIERKFGADQARQVSSRTTEAEIRLAGCESTHQRLEILRDLDREFKAGGINPGTSADLTVATLLAARLGSQY